MSQDHLKRLGWNAFFQKHWDALGEASLLPARVIGEQKNTYALDFGNQVPVWGGISGKFHFEASARHELPATGDWVACEWQPGAERAIIHQRLERQTCLVRKVAGKRQDDQILATNVDTVFITTSLNGDLNPRRLERFLTVVWDSGAKPVLLLTKADLVENIDALLTPIADVTTGVDVVVISTKKDQGLDQLTPYFGAGQTIVLLGTSGVGKSTLVNKLLGKEALVTQAIGNDDKGRHTTTSRYLFRLPNGAMLIDTPGMRELQVSDQSEGLAAQFEDIETLFTQCKFSDCQHKTEPGCAVLKALASGELPEERYENYNKLQKEMLHHLRKTDKGFASETKAKWKVIHKAQKAHTKRPKK